MEALWADVAYLDALRIRRVPGPPAEHEHDLVAAICTFGPESAACDVEVVELAVHNVVGQFVTFAYQARDVKIHMRPLKYGFSVRLDGIEIPLQKSPKSVTEKQLVDECSFFEKNGILEFITKATSD